MENEIDNVWEFLHHHKNSRNKLVKSISISIIILSKGLAAAVKFFAFFGALALFLWTINYIFPDILPFILKK